MGELEQGPALSGRHPPEARTPTEGPAGPCRGDGNLAPQPRWGRGACRRVWKPCPGLIASGHVGCSLVGARAEDGWWRRTCGVALWNPRGGAEMQ